MLDSSGGWWKFTPISLEITCLDDILFPIIDFLPLQAHESRPNDLSSPLPCTAIQRGPCRVRTLLPSMTLALLSHVHPSSPPLSLETRLSFCDILRQEHDTCIRLKEREKKKFCLWCNFSPDTGFIPDDLSSR